MMLIINAVKKILDNRFWIKIYAGVKGKRS